MKEHLENLDRQITEAIALGNSFSLPESHRQFSNVLFCGMGGSAISGDILSVLASRCLKKPFVVHRFPSLPKWAGVDTLAIFSSYSGNTAETLNLFHAAADAQSKIIAITSGGQLAEQTRIKKIPLIALPAGLPSRCAIGYLTFPLMTIFKKQQWANDSDCGFEELHSIFQNISHEKAKTLASHLINQYVHFYGTSEWMTPVLNRWRAQFAENSKALASSHQVPEMFHNEIEGWRFPTALIKKSTAVFFKDAEEKNPFEKKIQFAKKAIQKTGAEVVEISSEGKSLLARLFSLIYLGDWVSYELALLNQVDPLSIPTIEKLKKVNE